jgi:hypothetical protein
VAFSLCQRMCPDDMLGRMNATSRFIARATLPCGGILGGALGTALGLRPTMWMTAIGLLASSAVLIASPALRADSARLDVVPAAEAT